MNFQILINDEVKNVSQITAEKLSQIITTKYPTEGIGAAVLLLGKGTESYLDGFRVSGSPDDVIEVRHEVNKNFVFKGKITRAAMAEKMRLALHPELWASTLPEGDKTESAPKDKGEPELI